MTTKLSNCLCGQKAKFLKQKIWEGSSIKYWRVGCSFNDCTYKELTTFGTKEKEFCAELWNSTIKNRLKNV